MHNNIYLNFWAGNPIKDWDNLDTSPFFQLPKWIHRLLCKLNLSKRSCKFIDTNFVYFKYKEWKKIPYLDNSVDIIYCSHVLEHLYINDIQSLIIEFYRILKNDWILRILVPDLKNTINKLFETEWAFIDMTDNLWTLPNEFKKSIKSSVLEWFYGFPSLHKSIINDDKLEGYFIKNWKIKKNLTYLESDINIDLLKNIELEERCNNSLIFEIKKLKVS